MQQLQNSLRIYTVIFCLLFYLLPTRTEHTEDGLELLFRERTQSDWENVWHTEAHSRCRDKLVRHLFWACEKDIYRLTRRNRKRNSKNIGNTFANLKDIFNVGQPGSILMFPDDRPNTLLRTRRGGAPSITNECCTKTGCTWEEFAEYCPSNKRRNHY